MTEFDKSCSSIVTNQPYPNSAGYAAPPPTPIQKSSLAPTDVDQPLNTIAAAQTSDIKYDDLEEDITKVQTMQVTSPTDENRHRADLEALAKYLMQQSLHSTPKLSLSKSPTLVRRRSMVLKDPVVEITGCSMPSSPTLASPYSQKVGEALTDRATPSCACSSRELRVYTMEQLEMESSRGDIRRACEEEGEFLIAVSPELVEAAEKHWQEALSTRSGSSIGTSAMCEGFDDTPALPLFDVLHSTLAERSIRESRKGFMIEVLRICKTLLVLLIGDVYSKDQALSKSLLLKPLLYFCEKNQSNLARSSDDIVMSIFYEMDHKAMKEKHCFHVSLGNQIQAWSEGIYRVAYPHFHFKDCDCFYYDLSTCP